MSPLLIWRGFPALPLLRSAQRLSPAALLLQPRQPLFGARYAPWQQLEGGSARAFSEERRPKQHNHPQQPLHNFQQQPPPAELSEEEQERLRKEQQGIRFMADDFSKCFGCGAVLQSEEPDRPGFIPKETRLAHPVQPAPPASVAREALEKLEGRVYKGEKMFEKALGQPRRLVCQRCFSLRHYNKVLPVKIDPEDFVSQVKKIKWDHKALVLMIVDIFDFPGSFFPKIYELIGKDHPLVIVGNKADLLPEGADKEKVRIWLAHQTRAMLAKHLSLDIQIRLASGKTGEGVDDLATLIRRWQLDKTYLIGCSNVGKSQLLNRLLTKFEGDRSKEATTSPLPGTTLRITKFPLKGGLILHDTPGIMMQGQMYTLLTQKEAKLAIPSNPVKPVTYIIAPQRILYLGGLSWLQNLSEAGPVYFTVYVNNQLPVHVSSSRKSEKLLENLRLGKSETLFPPMGGEERMKTFPEMVPHDFVIKGNDVTRSQTDIVISGLGWVAVTCTTGECLIRVHAPKDIMLHTRDALFPEEIQNRGQRERGGLKAKFRGIQVSKKKKDKTPPPE